MLPNLTILMLLAAILPESMSGPTNATLEIPKDITLLPNNPGRVRALMKSLGRFDITIDQFQDLVKTKPFRLGESINDFYSKFMAALLKEKKGQNIAFSPFIIHVTMTMILLAIPQGIPSYQQLSDALALKPDYTREYLANVFQILDYYKEGNTGLEMASNLFYNLQGIGDFQPSYMSLLYGLYGAKAARLAMLGNPYDEDKGQEMAEDQINKYVYEHTHGTIRDFMPRYTLVETTRLVLVGALFHKDDWMIGFKEDWTYKMVFTTLDGTEIEHEKGMQVKSDKLRTAYTKDAKVLELKYKNGFVMFVALPHGETRDDLEKVARDFNVEEVEKNLQTHPRGVEVLMPGIEMDCEADVKKVMEDYMGVKDPFDFDRSNFHHMTTADGLAITGAVSQTKVKIDEKGSTSSSTIAVVACLRDGNEPVCLEFNRPYVWLIVDRKHKTIVLAGVVLNPAGNGNPGASPTTASPGASP